MDYHCNEKGVIHTTSYAQVNFIKSLLSDKNLRRLTITDPEIPRDEIIAKHSRNIIIQCLSLRQYILD